MNVPCVRVSRESGEAAHQRLVDVGPFDHDHGITVTEGTLYIPVVDADAVPDGLTVVDYESSAREAQTTSADSFGFEPPYERLGDIAILDEDDSDRIREIADVIIASDLKAETVANCISRVKSELRVRDWDVLTGDSTKTVHREYGHEFRLDIDTVYFSPRLATKHYRVVEAIQRGERVLDMFAGVGPLAAPAAVAGAEVVACDLNEAAVAFPRGNAAWNDVADQLTAIHGDAREVAVNYEGWADRLIMNLPHSASGFLDIAVRLASDDYVIHLYGIQHEDDPFGPGLAAVRAVVEPAYEAEVVSEYAVRSYAPYECNVCLDVRLMKRV